MMGHECYVVLPDLLNSWLILVSTVIVIWMILNPRILTMSKKPHLQDLNFKRNNLTLDVVLSLQLLQHGVNAMTLHFQGQ